MADGVVRVSEEAERSVSSERLVHLGSSAVVCVGRKGTCCPSSACGCLGQSGLGWAGRLVSLVITSPSHAVTQSLGRDEIGLCPEWSPLRCCRALVLKPDGGTAVRFNGKACVTAMYGCGSMRVRRRLRFAWPA